MLAIIIPRNDSDSIVSGSIVVSERRRLLRHPVRQHSCEFTTSLLLLSDITIACRRPSPSVESLDRSHRFLALSPLALRTRRPRHRPSTGPTMLSFLSVTGEASVDQICSINQSVNESSGEE